MTLNGATVQTNTYDSDGRRVKTVGTSTFVYVYEGANLVYQKNSGSGMIDKYFYANGLLLAEACECGYTYYYHEDALGSVRLITQSSNTFLFSSNYQPFGPSYQRTGASFFGYTGKPQDTATGLYYFGARFYDPATQRFITEDTLSGIMQDSQSLNRYVYARDNPLKITDLSGHDWWSSLTSAISNTASSISSAASTATSAVTNALSAIPPLTQSVATTIVSTTSASANQLVDAAQRAAQVAVTVASQGVQSAISTAQTIPTSNSIAVTASAPGIFGMAAIPSSLPVLPGLPPGMVQSLTKASVPLAAGTSLLVGVVAWDDIVHGRSQYYLSDALAIGAEVGAGIATGLGVPEVGIPIMTGVGLYVGHRMAGDSSVIPDIAQDLSDMFGSWPR